MTNTIQIRRGTAASWTSINPVLAAGEQGYETDTGKIKYGDGTTAWASLAYPGGGGVSTVSVVSANGFAGSVATATTTPAITLSTSVTGILKGNGTSISAATSGTDYAPGTSALATGILKSTTSTGALAIASAGDFPTLNQNTTGTAVNVTGTVAVANGGTGATSLTGILKGSGTSAFSAATSGTDYAPGTSTLATGILKSTTSTGALTIAVAGDFPTLNQSTTGSAATLTTTRAIYGNNFDGSTALTQVIASTYGGTGNGFAKLSGPTTSEKTFTLPNASATILTDNALVTVAQGGTGAGTLTGILKGSGTSAISAATAGTDYPGLAAVNVFSASQRGAVALLTDGSTITPDFSAGNISKVVLGGNRTLGVPSNLGAAQPGHIAIYQDATGSRTLAYAWCWMFAGGTAPTLSTAACSKDALYYDVVLYATSTVTITIASPGVVSWTAHGLNTGDRLQLTTTGALPTGLSASTTYWVVKVDANSFSLATTLANAAAGTKINTSGSQSGTHTVTAIEISTNLVKAFS